MLITNCSPRRATSPHCDSEMSSTTGTGNNNNNNGIGGCSGGSGGGGTRSGLGGSGGQPEHNSFFNDSFIIEPNSRPSTDNSTEDAATFMDDAVKINFSELVASTNTTNTIEALRICRAQIIRPMHWLLAFVGWRGFYANSHYSAFLRWRIANGVYTTLVIISIVFSYVYQTVACQWRLNIRMDTVPIQPPRSTQATTISHNSTTTAPDSLDLLSLRPGRRIVNETLPSAIHPAEMTGGPTCDHIITTYIIPNILHFIVYLTGFVYYRVQGCEELSATMEKVFLHCSSLTGREISQMGVIRRMRIYIAGGLLWVLCAITVHVLYDLSFAAHTDGSFALKFSADNCVSNWILLGFDMFGYVVLSCVSMAAIWNYAIHCEVVILYADSTVARLLERKIGVQTAIKDLYGIQSTIEVINAKVALMTSLVFFMLTELLCISLCIFVMNQYDENLVWAYRGFYVFHLVPIVLFPLIQAARLSRHCGRFRHLALQMRALGYQNACQLERDSFLNFVVANKFQVKLFCIPIRPSYIIGIGAIAAITILLLFQTGALTDSESSIGRLV